MILFALLACPLAGAAWLASIRTERRADAVHLVTAGATASSALGLALAVARAGTVAGPSWALRADALSAFMAALVAGIALVASLGVPSYLRGEEAAGRLTRARAFAFRPLYHLFVFTMLLAVTTDNLGLMWVAMEGTTLASVFLITIERTRASIEAAYKYLLICSVGIAVAFIGTVLVYSTALQALGSTDQALNWSALSVLGPQLSPRVIQLAFVFLLIGYGTKAGLVPMHTWLPDAHSEAPAPVSALMSGVLLNVGLYALVRFKTFVDPAIGPGFTDRLLIGFGLASMALAAASLWAPQNYKRMLAYSSVEHTGLVCLGLGFGGAWGVAGALLHMVTHGLVKSTLFALAGRVLQRYQTAEVGGVRGLRRAMPWTGPAFLASMLALVGLPPFGLFISEFLILRAGFAGGHAWTAGLALGLLVVAFGGMLRTAHRMFYGDPPGRVAEGEAFHWPLVPLGANLAMLLGLGVSFPAALAELLTRIARVIGAGG